jgi:hypothetical protein
VAQLDGRRRWAIVPGQMGRLRFCSYCAARERDLDPVEALLRRVCPRCELGFLLAGSRELVASCGDALLVVTADLRIGAASAGVEPLLGDPEPLLGRELAAVLDAGDLAHSARACAHGATDVSSHRVNVEGRALTARVGACDAPPAALVALG